MSAMEDVDEFIHIVHENDELAHYVGGCTVQLIAEAEAQLGTSLPPSYVAFLKNLGECDIAGEEFLGVWRRAEEFYGAVRTTLQLREIDSMPNSLIAFMSDGMGGYYVMDSSRLDEDGEAVVGLWVPGAMELVDTVEYLAPSFGAFALARTRNALTG